MDSGGSLSSAARLDGLDLAGVVLDHGFHVKLKSIEPGLVKFLKDPSTIREMFSVVFQEKEHNNKLSERFVQVLTVDVDELKNELLTNDAIQEGLCQFMTSELERVRNPRFAGSFSRIVESQLQIGRKPPGLVDFLATNLTNISYLDALSRILRREEMAADIPDVFFEDLMGNVDLEVTWKLRLLERCTRPPVCSVAAIRTPGLINRLFEISADTSACASHQVLAIRSVERIIKGHKDARIAEIVSAFESKFGINVIRDDLRAAPLLVIYPTRLKYYMGPFFKNKLPTFVCDIVIQRVRDMSEHELRAFVQENDLPTRIMKSSEKPNDTKRTNGHILLMAKVIDKQKCIGDVVQTQEWRDFFKLHCQIDLLGLQSLCPEDDYSDSGSLSSGDPDSDEGEVPGPPMKRNRICTIPRSAVSVPPCNSFVYVSNNAGTDSDKTNITALPRMAMAVPIASAPVGRRRHIGSVGAEELAHCIAFTK